MEDLSTMQGSGPPAPAAGAAAAGAGGAEGEGEGLTNLRARRLLACLREADASDLRRPELARLRSAQQAQREHAGALRELILGLVARRLRPMEVALLAHRVAARAGLEAGLGAERRAEVVARLVQALDERAAGRLGALGAFRVRRGPEEGPLVLRRVADALAALLAAKPGTSEATGPELDELRDAVCVIEGVVRKARGMLHVAVPLLDGELQTRGLGLADDRTQADLDRGVRRVNRLYDRAFGPRGPQQAPAYDMRAELRRPVWADSPRDRDGAFGASGGGPSPAGTPGGSEGGAGGSDSDAETYASGYLRDGLYDELGSTRGELLRKELFGGAESWGEKCADARSVELGDAILFYEAAVGDIFDQSPWCFKAALLAHAILTFKNAAELGSLIGEEDIFDTACKMEGEEPSAAGASTCAARAVGSDGEPSAKARVPSRAVLRRAFRMSFPGERDLRGVQALIDEQAKEASRREQGLEDLRQALAALQNLDAADFNGLARAAKRAVEPPAKKRKGTGPMPRSKRVLNLVNASKITEHF